MKRDKSIRDSYLICTICFIGLILIIVGLKVYEFVKHFV